MDALSPAEITAKAEEVGYKKANGKFSHTLVSGILAGMYIAFGAVFSITSISGLAGHIPFGIIKVIAGLAFSLGLILVMVAGAELFTGNALLIISWLNKKISGLQFIKNMILIWSSNFIGALIVVGLVYVGGWYFFGNGIIGETALNIGVHKLDYGFLQALSLGILCNILVCLGVWLAWSGRSTGDKVLGIIFPITAFVAGGFEHSVANMFYLPFAYLLKISGFVVENVDTAHLTLKYIFVNNLLPVTLGNIIGGMIFVGMAYWWLYGRK
ncbi:MAG: formate/nitrite transporter family protein [Candidatus Absconditabacteria bacterium]|nr:formate/nitrite transporter family protein [Candidatus Absconditabacteria bacterium]